MKYVLNIRDVSVSTKSGNGVSLYWQATLGIWQEMCELAKTLDQFMNVRQRVSWR